MIEQQRQRIERAVTEMVDDMDKSHLRKMQTDMHLCAAKCCQDMNGSIDSVQRCVDRCSAPLTRAQNYVQHELGEFQGRLQRCVMQCNDDVKVKMPANPSESDIAKYTDQFERCAIQCVDKHVGLIPTMMKTIKSVLAKGPESIPQV
ncbi:protein FAM136A-like [Zeugodacus cucurbitae]|uniref:Protein FAM136A n=1 Tax=Zeugodacus cucurbitae TaxID=28588 RepID=A0A0A1X4K8_ZEUCU|nr:protein FAM136A-like [Zeugodacus cucurbitae]